MAANHAIAIDLLFHLIVVTLDRRSPLITEILGTEGYRLPEALFFWQTSREFRYRLNPSQDFSFVFGDI